MIKRVFGGKNGKKIKGPPPAIKHSRVDTIHIYIIILNTKKTIWNQNFVW